MKFDKRFLITSLLTLSLGAGLAACGDDKDDDKCTANEYKCDSDGKTLLVCKDGSFSKKEECATSCDAEKKACVVDKSKCGNGVIDKDDGEICDIGNDKQKNTSDDVMDTDATCEMYGESSSTDKGKTWVAGNKPGCASDCRALAKGSCKTTQEAEAEAGEGVNGIATCGSTLAVDSSSKKATAKVTYKVGTTTQDSGVKAAIVCSGATAKVEASVDDKVATYVDASNGTVDLDKDLSALSVGEYACFIAVKAGSKGAVICPLDNGVPAKASGEVTAFDGSTVPYSVVASGEIKAIFSDFSANDMKTTIMSDTGMAATSGTANLRFVALDGTDFDVKKGQNAAGQTQALVVGGKGGSADKQWAKEKAITPETNSHLLVSGFTGVSSVTIKATSGNGSMYVVADDSASTAIISDFQAAKGDWKEVTGTVPAGATKLYIYAYGMGTTNLIIDNITLK